MVSLVVPKVLCGVPLSLCVPGVPFLVPFLPQTVCVVMDSWLVVLWGVWVI